MPGVYYPQCWATLHVIFDGFGPGDSAPVTFKVRPRSTTVHLNGYREADTFSMDFDAAAFPFSPELVRSMGVEIHIFQTDGLGRGIQTSDGFAHDTEGLVIAGLVDDARYHAGSDGRSFQVSGRDYTALMLDRQWDPQRRFPTGKPLDEAVQELVDEAAQADKTGRVLTVKVVGSEETPTLGPTNTKDGLLVTRGKYSVSKKGKIKAGSSGNGNVHTNKKGIPVKGGSNYWDVIYRQCIREGFIVYVRGTDVVISTPQTLTEATAGRIRKVAYGQNLAELNIDRKMGKESVPQIEVVCYDPVTMKQVKGLYPSDADVAKKPRVTGLNTKKDEKMVVVVHGVTDPGKLDKLAKMYYHNLARSESTVHFSTKDLKDLDGSDLIFLRPGDPVQLGFDSINDEEFRELAEFERFEKLLALGYDEQVAGVIAIEYDKINQFRVPFYTKDVELNFGIDSGLQLEVAAVNFVSPGRDDHK